MKTPTGKRRIPIVVYDKLTDDVLEVAAALKMPPNELMNRFAEACLMQIQAEETPSEPPPIVRHARRVLRRDLPRIDQLLQLALTKLIPGWEDTGIRWRTFLAEEVNAVPGPLTEDALREAVKRAERRLKTEEKADRRRKKEEKLIPKTLLQPAIPTQS